MWESATDSTSLTAYNQLEYPCFRTPLPEDVDLNKFDFDSHSNFLVKRVPIKGNGKSGSSSGTTTATNKLKPKLEKFNPSTPSLGLRGQPLETPCRLILMLQKQALEEPP